MTRISTPLIGLSGALLTFAGGPAHAAEASTVESVTVESVTVTARLRPEDAQTVPGGLSVVSRESLLKTGTYSAAQIIQLVPSLNYSSPNPRNTSLTIRGLGSSVVAIAQANDGLEPGVGFYVDQVYRARPASVAFDFLDVERVEVLRGPQGTLFGKNTTSGALNITTRAPEFSFGGEGELTVGNYGFRQGKLTVTGPLWAGRVAGRLTIVGTRREGTIRNVRTGRRQSDLDNLAIHGQLLFIPTDRLTVTLSADNSSINSECCTQVFVGVGPSLRPAARQFPALAAGLGYAPPSLNPYDRLTDIDADLAVNTDDAGYSAIATWDVGFATVTSVSAWRWWNWDAANDRDYTSVPIQLIQHIPSRQDQFSQELRIASKGAGPIDYILGLYGFDQTLKGQPITAYGPLATYWLLGPAPAFPAGLLDGYTSSGKTRFHSASYAAFGEATWRLTPALSLTGGLRYTYEDKSGRFDSDVFGGSAATGALLNSKLSILRPQSYRAKDKDGSLTGRVAASWRVAPQVMAYAALASAAKSGGINMSGLPLDAANNPALATAVIKPERHRTYEVGLKSRLFDERLTLNVALFLTDVRNFQTNVVDSGPGALRGYLANIERVRVRGLEVEGAWRFDEHLSGRFGLSRTDGIYRSYRNGPCPLERIGTATSVCDLSGRGLPNLPKFAWTTGAEYQLPITLGTRSGDGFLRLDLSARTRVFGDPTASRHTVIPGYRLVNGSVGVRMTDGFEASIWARNLFDQNYLQNVTVQAGNSGLIVGTPGDPRTFGVTLRRIY